MVSNIQNTSIGIHSGGLGEPKKRTERWVGAKPVTPKKAEENYIPAPESLATMIRSAIAALKDGSYWDRGSILNLLV